MDAIVWSAFAGLGGFVAGSVVMSIRAGRAVVEARQQSAKLDSMFRQSVREAAQLRVERDEQNLMISGLERLVELAYDEIERMKPHYLLGKRRQDASKRHNAKKREDRLGDEGHFARELLKEKGEVTTQEVVDLLGCDTRRAGYVMRGIGAQATVVSHGDVPLRVWKAA